MVYQDGTIYSFTVIYTPTEQFAHLAPYMIAIVDDGSRRFLVRMESFDSQALVEIGQPVAFSHLDEHEKPVYRLL